jgi:hypothetical protein
MAGVDLAAVNYRGSSAALSDLIAGHVHVMFDPIASSVGYIKAGQLRALGVTTAKRIVGRRDARAGSTLQNRDLATKTSETSLQYQSQSHAETRAIQCRQRTKLFPTRLQSPL